MNESYQWIVKAISTSMNDFHIDGCVKLIELFKQKYSDELSFKELHQNLYNKLEAKIASICVSV